MNLGELIDDVNDAQEMVRVMSIYLDTHDNINVGDLYCLSDIKNTMKSLVEIIRETEVNK